MTTLVSETMHLACPDCGGIAYRDETTFTCEDCGWQPRPEPHVTHSIACTRDWCKGWMHPAKTQNIDPKKRRPIRRCDKCSLEVDIEPDPS